MQNLLVATSPALDYLGVLQEHGYNCINTHPYWQCGDFVRSQGWIIDISIMPNDFPALLPVFLDTLRDWKCVFRVVQSRGLHIDMNNGFLGNEVFGKCLSIYLNEDTNGPEMVAVLREIAKDKGGPVIITDYSVGSNVYVRYGAFSGVAGFDEFGIQVTLIVDGFGNYFEDKIPSPPVMPPGIENIFLPLIEKEHTNERGSIRSKGRMPKHIVLEYYPVKLLKSNIRGNVYKAIRFTKYGVPVWCVVKEANYGVMIDSEGRSVEEVMTWQAEVANWLSGKVKMPSVIKSFRSGKYFYIVYPFIVSKSFTDIREEIMGYRLWQTIPIGDRIRVIDMLLDLIVSVGKMHKEGFVHRDINGNNCLLARNKSLYIIDVELSYDSNRNLPDPPFRAATKGYASPQQMNWETPTAADDIYALGATVANAFTGLEPEYFNNQFRSELYERMLFFTGIPSVASLIYRATDPLPSNRPPLEEFITVLTRAKKIETPLYVLDEILRVDLDLLAGAIDGGIASLCSQELTEDGLWFSYRQKVHRNNSFSYGQKELSVSANNGIAGSVYVAARLVKTQKKEELISTLAPIMAQNWHFLKDTITRRMETVPPGLHFGSAGIAVSMAALMDAGLLDSARNAVLLNSCFSRTNNDLDISLGIAGEGLAILQCSKYLQSDVPGLLLAPAFQRMFSAQQSSGAWLTRMSVHDQPTPYCNFSYGTAGICYFLLEAGKRLNHPASILSAERGLTYMLGRARKEGKALSWRNRRKEAEDDWSWSTGNTGIALSFLKGYEITKDGRWLDAAEKALLLIPDRPVKQSISLMNGLTGMGEVYLEAYRITNDPRWWRRAEWIAAVLYHTRVENPPFTWWLTQNSNYPTADLYGGMSGILHFLNRFLHPGQFSFPLLP
ncbi:MAG: lanthionine synthetase LanC family protein [Puia sp.]|nr:lanthionine synthetase LanC family protein [Puia sp.]